MLHTLHTELRVQREGGARWNSRTLFNLPKGASTATIESSTKFIGAAPAGSTVIGECTAFHRGRTTMVWQTIVKCEAGKLFGVVPQSQIVRFGAEEDITCLKFVAAVHHGVAGSIVTPGQDMVAHRMQGSFRAPRACAFLQLSPDRVAIIGHERGRIPVAHSAIKFFSSRRIRFRSAIRSSMIASLCSASARVCPQL